jgi:acetyl-CoA decarbonylase/synthase complex subunit delta
VLGAIDVPLIVWGIANHEKDEAVLKKIAEDPGDEQLILGPVEDKNHKGIGAAAMGSATLIIFLPHRRQPGQTGQHSLENLGMPMDRVIIDPTTGGLGYGLEYSYSVMERLRMAALAQGDDKLQMPHDQQPRQRSLEVQGSQTECRRGADPGRSRKNAAF